MIDNAGRHIPDPITLRLEHVAVIRRGTPALQRRLQAYLRDETDHDPMAAVSYVYQGCAAALGISHTERTQPIGDNPACQIELETAQTVSGAVMAWGDPREACALTGATQAVDLVSGTLVDVDVPRDAAQDVLYWVMRYVRNGLRIKGRPGRKPAREVVL